LSVKGPQLNKSIKDVGDTVGDAAGDAVGSQSASPAAGK